MTDEQYKELMEIVTRDFAKIISNQQVIYNYIDERLNTLERQIGALLIENEELKDELTQIKQLVDK